MPMNTLMRRALKLTAPDEVEEEVLPYRPLAPRPANVTAEDPLPRSTLDQNGKDFTQTAVQRHTWPLDTVESKAGSYVFFSAPILVKTPWELDRSQRPTSKWSRQATAPLSNCAPPRVFERLPREIYLCILNQLESAHLSNGAQCTACLQRDLYNLSLVGKPWNRVARTRLYGRIFLPTHEQQPKRKFSISKKLSRLEMLLRTLRDSGLATLVRELRITDKLQAQIEREVASEEVSASMDVLAGIIACCEGLDRVTGYIPLTGRHSAKTHLSLAYQDNLKEHAWVLNKDLSLSLDGTGTLNRATFLDCHDYWTCMETLSLCTETQDILGAGMLSDVLHRLPALKNLMISGFIPLDFHDGTLQTLPALQSLRLQDLAGISDVGLEQLVHSRLASSLQSLSLINLSITSLFTLQGILISLHRLRRLTLQQDGSLQVPPGAAMSQPFLTGASLTYIHWDIRAPGPATEVLTQSISCGGFPRLRTIRAPCDYDGQLQALCRPIAKEYVSEEDFALVQDTLQLRRTHALYGARLRAQKRIRELRKKPSMSVVVQDGDTVTHRQAIGSYIGNVRSDLKYCLEPDVEGSFEALAQIADVSKPVLADSCWAHPSKAPTDADAGYQALGQRRERLVGLEKLF